MVRVKTLPEKNCLWPPECYLPRCSEPVDLPRSTLPDRHILLPAALRRCCQVERLMCLAVDCAVCEKFASDMTNGTACSHNPAAASVDGEVLHSSIDNRSQLQRIEFACIMQDAELSCRLRMALRQACLLTMTVTSLTSQTWTATHPHTAHDHNSMLVQA